MTADRRDVVADVAALLDALANQRVVGGGDERIYPQTCEMLGRLAGHVRDGLMIEPIHGVASTWPTLRELALQADEVAQANGFDPCTWENLPGKLELVGTELDEIVDAVKELETLSDAEIGSDVMDDANWGIEKVQSEFADLALRLLAVVHGTFGGDFHDRRRLTPARPAFLPIEVLIWPIQSHLHKAAQRWRCDQRDDARTHLEYALRAMWALAARIGAGFDLTQMCSERLAQNRLREPLHGKRRTL